MNGKMIRFAVAAVLLSAGSAMAADVAPTDVKFEDGAVAVSLTGTPGDAAQGREIFADTGLGNCLACHAVTEYSAQLFHGEVGPSLDGVASRYDEAQLRGIVSNAKQLFTEDTVMPGFYSLDVGVNVVESRAGQTILSAQQVEDVVAYLATLKE